MKSLGIGLIGTGFMGKAHALAFGAARAVMGDVPESHLAVLCDTPAEKAKQMADQFGFAKSTADWTSLISDPDVNIVSITTPNALHFEMAIAAIKAGKHVYCEKPLALTLDQAREMRDAVRTAGIKTMVGYNYIKNPAFTHACRLIQGGEIGEIVHFRGWVDEDYQADPALPWTWRAKLADAGLGALGDMGCHLVSMAYGLAGPIDSLIADMQTVHTTRPLPDGTGRAKVENEDTASALVRFANGAQGSLSTSRSAWGRKNRLAWEVHGTKGMICFDQERMNELQLYHNSGDKAQQGFTTILTGPAHPPYGEFCPAPGHQLGFNDLKVIEAAALLRAIRDDNPAYPDFEHAYEFEKVIHAIAKSATDGTRVSLSEV
ncbi:MAG: Gfo/Idh/MocA family oxidoreductase [Thalassospira sp.]|uniref:Gfo/Idh/MocA family protein n=1 Tax=Thalassospira sp. TaxID=1912094 RepID=UPI001B1C9743|nr:Gfo/Idh/MocA family oxidoreductase [Thalassospira sp.]MBO6578693.1 Gfo/Idh/MocA family oxidoreductase [Thalassospira sp.]MBO6804978.1 Gfo/Idh/MocA family oxidoreductase [Thalassospira sp.]MBO6817064.1 Gfo/Idh/MocA family oxidoreductase [Thalassospira sp.]MBO6888276.1 Gfo/Idh/MocA family oxidoreductase [Thalassospira sp.]